MKNETLLKELLKINSLAEKDKIKLSLDTLISKVQQEILVEENKNQSSKHRLNKCLSYHKKLLKSTKPFLAYACNDQFNGKQAFCNSFYLTVLCDDDKLPIDDYTSSEFNNYPNLTRLFDRKKYGFKTFTCNVGKLMNAFKAHNIIQLVNDDFNAVLNRENFELFIYHLNYKNSDSITLYCDEFEKRIFEETLKPVFTEKKNGSFGIILPMKKNDDENIKMFFESDLS